jgi:PhnB protein
MILKHLFKSFAMQNNLSAFAPMLSFKDGAAAIEFYKKAFGAVEHRRFDHEGRVHVAEMFIEGALFRLREETPKWNFLSPETLGGITCQMCMFVADPDAMAARAEAAGATIINPPQDYEYGYRQVSLKDPFGHYWQFEKKI